jgi:DNA-binding MarR family transcriptional regulator
MGSHTSAFGADVRATLDAFRRIVQTLRSSSREAERHVGLSAAQLFALQQLASMAGASINDLAARTFTHQSSVSVVVQRLVSRRLVAKTTSADDRRRVRLSVTEAGRALLRRSPEPIQERLIAGIATLGAGERRALVGALTTIADTLAVGEGAPPMLFEDGKGRKAAGRRTRRAR